MNAIEIRGLKKVYATGTEALKDVSIDVPQGDFFALLGANGAGKTTIIGILCGLVNKTGGSAKIFDVDVDQNPDQTKEWIGIVPQEFNFNIFETTYDIVMAQAGYYGIPKSEAAPRAEEILKQLGLWEKKDEPSRALSGGMKRRLMIARALMHKPRLLILDEPTAGVDVELRHGMWEYLRSLNAAGVTILLTTHYLEEAEQLCRNVAIIRKGEIIRQGNVKELLKTVDTQVYSLDIQSKEGAIIPEELKAKRIDNDTIEIETNGSRSISDALRILTDGGITIKSIQPTKNRLEQLFLDITNEPNA